MNQIGIYARVSVLHDDNSDHTIEHQIFLAKQTITKMKLEGQISYYIDRGYSGQTFQRPGFMRLIHDCAKGKVDMILVKDFSRLGRNYLELGYYLEEFFPKHRVRVIAIGEAYDSKKDEIDFSFRLKNVMNEWMAKETGQKVRQIKQRQKKEGSYLGSKAPYGYRIINKDGKRILVEDESMEVLSWIRQWRLEGDSSHEIAQKLNQKRICRPEQYRKLNSLTCPETVLYQKWDSAGVRRIWNQKKKL